MLKTYLHVRDADGLVVNASDWDGVTPWSPPPGETAIEKPAAPVEVWIGWTYDAATGVFSLPAQEPTEHA